MQSGERFPCPRCGETHVWKRTPLRGATPCPRTGQTVYEAEADANALASPPPSGGPPGGGKADFLGTPGGPRETFQGIRKVGPV